MIYVVVEKIYEEYIKNSIVHSYDKSEKVVEIPKNSHFLMPITYVSPTYLSVFSIAIAASLTKLGNRISIILNDNNLIIHKNVVRNSRGIGYLASGKYIQYITDQMLRLFNIFGGDVKNLIVIRAFETWASIVDNYSEFIDFYNLLGSLRISKEDLGTRGYDEIYHIVERPFVAFTFARYENFIKSGLGDPEFLILSNKDPEPYRNAIAEITKGSIEGLRIKKVAATRILPSMQYNDNYLSCQMKFSMIKELITKIKPSSADIDLFTDTFIKPTKNLLEELGKVRYNKTKQYRKNKTNDFPYEVYNLLNDITNLLSSESAALNSDLKVASPMQAENIRKIFTSKRMLDLIKFCDGEHTVVEIAREAHVQLSNASVYISKLKEAGLISSDKKPRILVDNITFPIRTIVG